MHISTGDADAGAPANFAPAAPLHDDLLYGSADDRDMTCIHNCRPQMPIDVLDALCRELASATRKISRVAPILGTREVFCREAACVIEFAVVCQRLQQSLVGQAQFHQNVRQDHGSRHSHDRVQFQCVVTGSRRV